jgi:ribonuclease-3
LSELEGWLKSALGITPERTDLFERALTHSSRSTESYERLEFLGDRVLGMVIAAWLYERFPGDAEGVLSRRLNTLVSRATCAEIGRAIGVGSQLRLGKQALDDGAFESDNVLGDAVEALIGAMFLDQGMDAAQSFIRRNWDAKLGGQTSAPRHPKSALQEWAAAHNRKAPAYEVVERSGPDHAPRFRVRVSVGSAGQAEADGRSKQEAESAAASALLCELEGNVAR